MGHVLAKTILITQVTELIAKEYKLTLDTARNRFYESDIIEMLDDDETGLYGSSALYLLSLYEMYLKDRFIEIVGDNYIGSYNKSRYACRGVAIKEDKILLSFESKNELWVIPGGGKEEGETDVECLTRELAEETGYIVKERNRPVKVIEYYEDVRYVTLYFLCDVVGETTPKLTDEEKKAGLEGRWVLLNDALSIFKEYSKYKDINENKRGLYLREYSTLLKMIDNKYISLL